MKNDENKDDEWVAIHILIKHLYLLAPYFF